MTELTPPIRRVSFIFLAIIVVSIVLSIVAFYQAIDSFNNLDSASGTSFVMLGVSGLALSAYMLLQTRKRTRQLTIKPQRITTEETCQKCEFKNLRDFKAGDYVFKETEECPKCKDKMVISSVYGEVKEKKKG